MSQEPSRSLVSLRYSQRAGFRTLSSSVNFVRRSVPDLCMASSGFSICAFLLSLGCMNAKRSTNVISSPELVRSSKVKTSFIRPRGAR